MPCVWSPAETLDHLYHLEETIAVEHYAQDLSSLHFWSGLFSCVLILGI